MKKVANRLLIVFFLLAPSGVLAEALTEAMITGMIDKIDKAVSVQDAGVIASLMSTHVEIVMIVNAGGNTQVMRANKAQYLEMLQQGWAASTNYEYARTNMNIKIKSPNKAIVTTDVSESMTVNGQNMSGHTKEKATVELIDGKPLITRIVANVRM